MARDQLNYWAARRLAVVAETECAGWHWLRPVVSKEIETVAAKAVLSARSDNAWQTMVTVAGNRVWCEPMSSWKNLCKSSFGYFDLLERFLADRGSTTSINTGHSQCHPTEILNEFRYGKPPPSRTKVRMEITSLTGRTVGEHLVAKGLQAALEQTSYGHFTLAHRVRDLLERLTFDVTQPQCLALRLGELIQTVS